MSELLLARSAVVAAYLPGNEVSADVGDLPVGAYYCENRMRSIGEIVTGLLRMSSTFLRNVEENRP